jgi:hypothetical protein
VGCTVRDEDQEAAFVANLLTKNAIIQDVQPSSAVWVGNGLECLVRKDVIGRVGKLSIGSPRPRTTALDVLEWLDAVENMANIAEIHAVVISAKNEAV